MYFYKNHTTMKKFTFVCQAGGQDAGEMSERKTSAILDLMCNHRIEEKSRGVAYDETAGQINIYV